MAQTCIAVINDVIGLSQVFNSIVEFVAINVVDKRHVVSAMHDPDEPMD